MKLFAYDRLEIRTFPHEFGGDFQNFGSGVGVHKRASVEVDHLQVGVGVIKQRRIQLQGIVQQAHLGTDQCRLLLIVLVQNSNNLLAQ